VKTVKVIAVKTAKATAVKTVKATAAKTTAECPQSRLGNNGFRP
jgi:hypothetical protein